jgi:transcriptional regulator
VYVPAHFGETRPEVLHALIRDYPLACLVTLDASGLVADHVPLLIDPDPAPLGRLLGHVARGNPVWQTVGEALAVFQGPAAYVSPSWYASKEATGKVVPTWDYAVVHAHGRLRAVDDSTWVRDQVERLTAGQEAGRPHPWAVSDAPTGYIEQMLRGIVGIELVINRLVGKWKVSQNKPAADRAGVIAVLRAVGSPVADLVPPGG